MTAPDVDVETILKTGRSRRVWPWLVAVGATLAAAAVAFLLTRGSGAPVVVPPQQVQATTGQIVSSVTLSGAASAPQSGNLTFGTAGTVASVAVAPGDTVKAGDVIASLESADLQRAVEQSQLTLTLRRQQYSEMLLNPNDPSTASKISSLDQAQHAAQQRVDTAQAALDALLHPTTTDLEAASAALVQKRQALQQAQAALDALLAGPTDQAVTQAQAAISTAESSLLSSANQLALAISGARSLNLAGYIGLDPTATDLQVEAALMADTDPLLALEPVTLTTTAQRTADASYRLAKSNLATARDALVKLQTPPTQDVVTAAQLAVSQAQAVVDTAQSDLEGMTERWSAAQYGQAATGVADDSAITAARDELSNAQAALQTAQLNIAAQFSGPAGSAVTSAQLAILNAEQSLQNAQDALAAAQLKAPFDGTIEAVNVNPGDEITAAQPIAALLNESNIEVDLVVTESELASIAPGQTGTATFDAFPGVEYPVRVTEVSRVPTVSQGVTTYPVKAVILTGAEAAAARGATAVAGTRGGGAALGQFLQQQGVVIPEGVNPLDVLRALAAGQPLPAGVTVPEGFTLPQRLLQGLRGAGGAGGAGDNAGASTVPGGGQSGSAPSRPAASAAPTQMPAPGMSASVRLITNVGAESVLVPMSAVRQINGAYYVRVPDPTAVSKRVEVTIGKSDGTNVEVLSGLAAGDTVLIGAETEGVPLTVTSLQQSQQQSQGQRFFFGGGGGGGAFGGGGGGGAGR